MAFWRFWDYETEHGINPIKDWYAVQDVAVQVAFDFVLRELEETDDWEENPRFKLLTRKHLGLGEIRFVVTGKPKRKFRPVGIWRPDSRDFILLVGAEKLMSGLVYIPPNALDLALEYKALFEQGRGRIYEHV